MKIKASTTKDKTNLLLSDSAKEALKNHQGEIWIVIPEKETQSQIWYFREYLVKGFVKWSISQGQFVSEQDAEMWLLSKIGCDSSIETLSNIELNAAIESVKVVVSEVTDSSVEF